MKRRSPAGQMSDAYLTALFLTLSGGFQDAYAYCFRGQVFANAQTGNIVLLSAHLLHGSWGNALHYAIPLVAFPMNPPSTIPASIKSRRTQKFLLPISCSP